MEWNKINFNKQNIKFETTKAVLIACPSKSVMAGWSFWHPKKLVKEIGGKGYHLSFSYTDEFVFKLTKGKGVYKTEMNLSPGQMEDVFNNKIQDEEEYTTIKEPEKVEMEVGVKEELLNEDI